MEKYGVEAEIAVTFVLDKAMDLTFHCNSDPNKTRMAVKLMMEEVAKRHEETTMRAISSAFTFVILTNCRLAGGLISRKTDHNKTRQTLSFVWGAGGRVFESLRSDHFHE